MLFDIVGCRSICSLAIYTFQTTYRSVDVSYRTRVTVSRSLAAGPFVSGLFPGLTDLQYHEIVLQAYSTGLVDRVHFVSRWHKRQQNKSQQSTMLEKTPASQKSSCDKDAWVIKMIEPV